MKNFSGFSFFSCFRLFHLVSLLFELSGVSSIYISYLYFVVFFNDKFLLHGLQQSKSKNGQAFASRFIWGTDLWGQQ